MSGLGRLRRFERGSENVGSWHLRVQRTYQSSGEASIERDVIGFGEPDEREE
jgi:hypothetical protein